MRGLSTILVSLTGEVVLGHLRLGVVLVLHHLHPRLGGDVEEPEQLAGGGRHQQELLGIELGGVALRLAGGDA